MESPQSEDVARIGELTGRKPVGFRRASGGYTAAERWVVDLEGSAGAFAKIGVDRLTAGWLRQDTGLMPLSTGTSCRLCRGGTTATGRCCCWRT